MIADNRDLTIDTVLNDPMIRAVMKADRVEQREFERFLRSTAGALEADPVHAYRAPTTLVAAAQRKLLQRVCFA